MSDHQLQRLMPRHFKILELTLAGHDLGTIAEATGLAKNSISAIQRSPVFQLELTRQREKSQEVTIGALDRSAAMGKAQSILEQNADKAAKTLVDFLDSPDPNMRFRGADKILDRVFSAKDAGSKVVVNVTAEQANLLHIAIQESNYVRANCTPAQSPQAERPIVHEASGEQDPSADGPVPDAA